MFPFPTTHRNPALSRDKQRAKKEAEEAKEKADNLPKKYNYYCPNCLYQTNEYTRVCPRCKQYLLERTMGAVVTEDKNHKQPDKFEFYCPACLYQTNEYRKICPKCAKQRMQKAGKEP